MHTYIHYLNESITLHRGAPTRSVWAIGNSLRLCGVGVESSRAHITYTVLYYLCTYLLTYLTYLTYLTLYLFIAHELHHRYDDAVSTWKMENGKWKMEIASQPE